MSQAPVDRRTVLKAGGALAVLGLAGCSDDSPAPSGTPTTTAPAPSSASTPASTQATTAAGAPDWTGLRRGLAGRLYRPGDSGYPEAHRLFNPRFDSVQPAGVVRAATADDVRESVLFARKYGLVCVPKGGGHSYVGASTVGAGLVVDLGPSRRISYADDVVTIGAGAKLYDVHAELDKYDRSLPTGTCPTVGIAGLALGGGMGVHTRFAGLTCDRILSLQVVTADGVARTVSATQEPELFWALRGGGGGNLAIVTAFRLSTISAARLGFFRLGWPESRAAAVVRGWQRFAAEAPTSAWANVHLDAEGNGPLSVHVIGVSTTGSAAAAAAQLESLVGTKATSRSLTVKDHLQAVRYLGGGTSSPRTGFPAGSDVLRGPVDDGAITALLGAVKAGGRSGLTASAILDPLGGQAAKEPAGGSAWPWRSALGVIQWYAGTADHPTAAELQRAQKWIATGHQAVAKASAGGYVNYLEPGRALPSYYGDNLERLRAAKAKYDSGNFFRSGYAYR